MLENAAKEPEVVDLAEMLKHQNINYLGALYVLDAVLPHFLQQRHGHISLISSVAGFRGLPNSLAYGPTKAALINLAEVLYMDLHARGAGVSLVNPGFVETPLTAQNSFHMPLPPGWPGRSPTRNRSKRSRPRPKRYPRRRTSTPRRRLQQSTYPRYK